MGAGPSAPGHDGQSKRRGIPLASARKFKAKWQAREFSTQLFAVIRHAERADGAFAFLEGGRWHETEDFKQWHTDPPLSDDGVTQAAGIARQVRKFAEENHTAFHIVVSSPYRRCIQTAVAICEELGPTARLLVDQSIGEVYGPSVMGSQEPSCATRPLEETWNYCRERGIVCQRRLLGQWPTWPEDLRAARRRFAERFLTFLHRSTTVKRNCILVTHADGVAASLKMLPPLMDRNILKMDYGSRFLAKRRLASDENSFGETCERATFHGVLPVKDAAQKDPTMWASVSDGALLSSQASNTLVGLVEQDYLAADAKGVSVTERCGFNPPKESDGWAVDTFDLELVEAPNSGKQPFRKRLRTFAQGSRFSAAQIEQLLGGLSEGPFGQEDVIHTDYGAGGSLPYMRVQTPCSLSTVLCGVSDVASDLGCQSMGGSRIGSESPKRRPTDLSLDEEALAVIRGTRPPLQESPQSAAADFSSDEEMNGLRRKWKKQELGQRPSLRSVRKKDVEDVMKRLQIEEKGRCLSASTQSASPSACSQDCDLDQATAFTSTKSLASSTATWSPNASTEGRHAPAMSLPVVANSINVPLPRRSPEGGTSSNRTAPPAWPAAPAEEKKPAPLKSMGCSMLMRRRELLRSLPADAAQRGPQPSA